MWISGQTVSTGERTEIQGVQNKSEGNKKGNTGMLSTTYTHFVDKIRNSGQVPNKKNLFYIL